MSWKKIALTTALLPITLTATARYRPKAPNSEPIEHPWIAAIKLFTQSSKLDGPFVPGSRFSLTYLESSHWYTTGKLFSLKKNEYIASLTQGFTYTDHSFSPYLEVTIDRHFNQDPKSLSYFTYDAGTYYKINKYISPLLELDNFIDKKKITTYLGLKISWNARFSNTLTASWQPNTNGTGLSLAFAYRM